MGVFRRPRVGDNLSRYVGIWTVDSGVSWTVEPQQVVSSLRWSFCLPRLYTWEVPDSRFSDPGQKWLLECVRRWFVGLWWGSPGPRSNGPRVLVVRTSEVITSTTHGYRGVGPRILHWVDPDDDGRWGGS